MLIINGTAFLTYPPSPSYMAGQSSNAFVIFNIRISCVHLSIAIPSVSHVSLRINSGHSWQTPPCREMPTYMGSRPHDPGRLIYDYKPLLLCECQLTPLLSTNSHVLYVLPCFIPTVRRMNHCFLSLIAKVFLCS